MGEVRKRKVQRKNEDQPRDVHPLRWVRSRNDDFEKRKQAVQAMLADVAPGVELLWKPRPFVQNHPIYDRHEERVRDDGRVEQRMKRLQRSRESIEQRSASKSVRGSMNRRNSKVESDAPICQDGEVAEGHADISTAAEVVVRTFPSDDEESRNESVYADDSAESEEKPRAQEPGCFEAIGRIPEIEAEPQGVLDGHFLIIIISV